MLTTTNASDASHTLPRFVRPSATEAVAGYPRVNEHRIYLCHRYQRRTVPCSGPQCSLCLQFIPKDNRIFIPLTTLTTARTVVVDLPTSFHAHLVQVEEKAITLRTLRMSWSRSTPYDNGPIVMKVVRLREGEERAFVLEGFDDILDRMLWKNVEYWHDHGEIDKSAATALRVVRDRRRA
jgi:hypothetical protein